MEEQIRLRLDMQDISDLANGKVLYKDKQGRPHGERTGNTFTHGENPVEICLTESEQATLRNALFPPQTDD